MSLQWFPTLYIYIYTHIHACMQLGQLHIPQLHTCMYECSWDNFTFIRYDIGGGTKVWFWHDLWQGKAPLKERYPNLCLIARDSEATVVDYAEIRSEQLSWMPVFICVALLWHSFWRIFPKKILGMESKISWHAFLSKTKVSK